jgi:hypothetical protein
MYDLTLGQNGHFSIKKIIQKNHMFFMSHAFSQSKHPLIIANTLVKLNLLKSHELL